MKYKFIVLEGVDGAGKSTICDWISQNYGYQKHKSIGNTFATVKAHFSPKKVSIQERFSFLCGEAINNAFIVKENLDKGQPIIFDRYYYSTLVYCESLKTGISKSYESLFSALPQPDLVLYLDSSFEKIESRLSKRDNVSYIENYFLEQKRFKQLQQNYKDTLGPNHVLIDNNKSLEHTFHQLKKILD